MKKVFLSSTAQDLARYREAAYRAIEGMEGYHCVRMEDFGARDATSDELCRRKVQECDLFVAIVGHCYGSISESCAKSYTEEEYGAALAVAKPRLIFLAPDTFPLPANIIEPDDKRQKQRSFRQRVNADRIRDTFTSPEDLAWRVVRAIHNWGQEAARTDLASVIDLYHRTVQAGTYDEACLLYKDRLEFILFYKLGASRTCIELLLTLFPDGEDHLPRLSRKDYQAAMLNALANSYIRVGEPRRAVPLLEKQIRVSEQLGDKKNLGSGLGAVACAYVALGRLAEAESNHRHCIDIYRDIGEELQESVAHQDLGLVLVYKGAFDDAWGELDTAVELQKKVGHRQTEGLSRVYQTLCAHHLGKVLIASELARQTRDLAFVFGLEPDIIRADWLVGATLLAQSVKDPGRQQELLAHSETHLTHAIKRCRRISLVELEPDILLAWSRLYRLKNNLGKAREHAQEALSIADRCEHRLQQADIHNQIARLDSEIGVRKGAEEHASIAYERAWCDGPPNCYKPALDEAKRSLDELGAPIPRP